MWDTNKASRQEACTTYIVCRRPLEYLKVPLLGLLLTCKLKAGASRHGEHPHSRWEFSQKNREQDRNDTGESVFPETDPISLFFRLAYIPFVTHRDE